MPGAHVSSLQSPPSSPWAPSSSPQRRRVIMVVEVYPVVGRVAGGGSMAERGAGGRRRWWRRWIRRRLPWRRWWLSWRRVCSLALAGGGWGGGGVGATWWPRLSSGVGFGGRRRWQPQQPRRCLQQAPSYADNGNRQLGIRYWGLGIRDLDLDFQFLLLQKMFSPAGIIAGGRLSLAANENQFSLMTNCPSA